MEAWIERLNAVEDPRSREGLHSVGEILFLVLTGVLAGESSLVGIAEWGEENIEWLQKTLPYAHGTASHDTLGRVLGMIRPDRVKQVFCQLVQDLVGARLGEAEAERHVAVDGKAVRGSRTASGRGQHAVHAWDVELRVLLDLRWVDEKTNEITVMPALVEALDLKKAVVTVDAMGAHLPLVDAITQAGGNVIVGLKGNQKTIREEVELLLAQPPKGVPVSRHEEHEKEHGRIESRVTTVLGVSESLRTTLACPAWPVHSVVKVVSSRTVKGRTTEETRYFLSTCPLSSHPASRQARLIREHWSVENHLHRSLDVSYGEDAATARAAILVRNLGILRRLAKTIVDDEPDPKWQARSTRARLRRFDRDDRHRDAVLSRFARSLSPTPTRVIRALP